MSPINQFSIFDFHLMSFNDEGDVIEHAGQAPAFFALVDEDNKIVGYFTTVEAANEWVNDFLLYSVNN